MSSSAVAMPADANAAAANGSTAAASLKRVHANLPEATAKRPAHSAAATQPTPAAPPSAPAQQTNRQAASAGLASNAPTSAGAAQQHSSATQPQVLSSAAAAHRFMNSAVQQAKNGAVAPGASAGADAKDAEAQEAVLAQDHLADIERQVISHGRHPAEWDRMNTSWLHETDAAAPYFAVLDSVAKPTRAREVICELLACGLPLRKDAHLRDLNNALAKKAFVRKSRKLLALGRTPEQLALHVDAAKELGVLPPEQTQYIAAALAALQGVAIPARAAALAEHEEANADVAGTMGARDVEAWVDAMGNSTYEDHLRLLRQAVKGTKKAGADGASASSKLAVLSEKTAQYLASFYYHEVKEVKVRKEAGQPPRDIRRAAGSDAASGAAGPHSTAGPDANATGAASAPAGGAAGADAGAAAGPGTVAHAAAQARPGEFLGYYSPAAGTFRPLDSSALSSLKASLAAPAGKAELEQLADAYKPVLWAPEKPLLQAAAIARYAEKHPEADVTGADAVKKAMMECCSDALKVLREDHFGEEAVRQRMREVALMVTERVTSGDLKPVGSTNKTLENLKVKTLALQLPPRPADAKPAVERLLAWAEAEHAAGASAGT